MKHNLFKGYPPWNVSQFATKNKGRNPKGKVETSFCHHFSHVFFVSFLRGCKPIKLRWPFWKKTSASHKLFWLVVSTHLKNISQIGNLPQIGVKIKHIWNQLVFYIETNREVEIGIFNAPTNRHFYMLYILQAGWFKGYPNKKKKIQYPYKVCPEPIVINGVK